MALPPLPPTFPDLTSLSVFVSVVELGSVSRAAALHGVSQPSASERIRHLEQKLGVTLLQRSPRGSVPTPEGALVAEWSIAVLAAADQLRIGVASLGQAGGGQLDVAASYTIAEHLLPRWLGVLHARHPEVAVALEVVNSAAVLERVRSGAADVGFIESPGATAGLASRVVGTDELVVVVDADHPWAGRAGAVDGAELASTPLVLREPGSGTRDALLVALDTRGLGPPVAALELGSTASVKAAVAAGSGPAVLSRVAVEAEVRSGRLRVVPVDGLDLHRTLRAVWRRGGKLAAAAATLVARAAEEA
jgi:DNA-binding transcriptional LysR family regulator